MKTIHTVSGQIKIINPLNLDKNRKPRPDTLVKFDRVVVVGETLEDLKADFLAKIFRTVDPPFSAFWIKEIKKAQSEKRFELVDLYSVNTHGKTVQ